MNVVPGPPKPTAADVARHNLTHMQLFGVSNAGRVTARTKITGESKVLTVLSRPMELRPLRMQRKLSLQLWALDKRNGDSNVTATQELGDWAT